MNKSYKVALVAAIVLCGALLAYYLTQEEARSSARSVTPPVPSPAQTTVASAPASPQTLEAATPPPPPRRTVVLPEPSSPAEPAPPPAQAPGPAEPPTLIFDGATPEEAPATAPSSAPPIVAPSPPPFEGNLPTPRAAEPPPAAQPAPEAPKRELVRRYTIQPGDTLISIAIAKYGSEKYWDEIAQMNPMIDPIRLRPGGVIRLPGPSQLNRPPAPLARSSDGSALHTIRPGETLGAIASRHYNNASAWRIIYNANRERIGNDPDRIQVGTRLVIPPKTRVPR